MQIEIDISNVEYNLKTVKTLSHSEVCAVVKADAYGHGALRICKALESEVCCFATATYGEAKKLSVNGINKDVLILGADRSEGEKNIIPSVVSLEDYFKKRGKQRFSIIVNTGMNRLGVDINELKYVKKTDNVFSIFSHVYSVDSMARQTAEFDRAVSELGIVEPYKHLYASNWIYAQKSYDFIRCGLNLYGYGFNGLRPAMRVSARIIRLANVNKGENVGYGTCILSKNSVIATVNMGYRDGFPRKKTASEKRYVVVNGNKCKVVGQICMDMFMVDVTNVKVKVGDEVCIVGKEIDGEEFARQNCTVVYEILTTFYHREDIIYKNS